MPQPVHLLKRLQELSRREKWLRFVWGLARWLAAVLLVIVLCCLVDWIIDRWYDTPSVLRWLMRLSIVSVAGWLGYHWLVKPQQLNDQDMLFWLERNQGQYNHRLISAFQLNAPEANRGGMSQELIDALTAEVEQEAERTSFLPLLDNSRVKNGLLLLLPPVLLVASCFLLAGPTASALAERLFGSHTRIPRSVQITSQASTLWPRGEPVELEFHVTGLTDTSVEGVIEIRPEGQSAEKYPLVYREAAGSPITRYVATIPPSSTPFTYRAWLGDGRTQESGEVTFVPRPVLSSWEAALVLPRYVGLRPDQQPYELPQPKGDVKPVPASAMRLQVTTPTPIVEAVAELLGPIVPDMAARLAPLQSFVTPAYLLDAQRAIGWTPSAAGPLFVMERVPLKVEADGLSASGLISPPLRTSAYRILVTDRYGLSNRPVPRRAITFHADELPQITLLPERFTEGPNLSDDLDLDGMPIPLNRPIRIAYIVRDDLALAQVWLRYRLNEGSWHQLPLTELTSPPRNGVFDPRTGAFTTSTPKEQVAFFAVPPDDANRQLGRSLGGGRFDFQTRGLPDIKLGDVLEYYIEARDRHDDANRLTAKSVVRRKTVVTESQFVDWLVHTVQQETRLRQVERQQRKVFEPK
ncbi:MAG: hypothetical protein U0796_03830 [Gemmatales bacterium]